MAAGTGVGAGPVDCHKNGGSVNKKISRLSDVTSNPSGTKVQLSAPEFLILC
jgi:hypothetical protein